MRLMFVLCALVVWLTVPSNSIYAQSIATPQKALSDYPRRSIRFIIPFAPGGGTDLIARLLAQKVSEAWGQPIVVDNRAGGGSTIGMNTAAKSAPDGYTLLLASMSIASSPALYRELPYDTEKELAPVTLLATQPHLLAVHPAVPAKSVTELIALARSKPGEIRYATSGGGASDRLAAVLFLTTTKINQNLVHVPYKGASLSVNATIAGEVHMLITPIAPVLPFSRTGRLRGLAVTGATRAKVAPELPTIAEAGVPGYEFDGWYGLLVPSRTPTAIIKKINEGFNRALAMQEVQERLADIGIEPLGGTQEKFAVYLKAEIRKWTKVIKEADIHLD